MPEKALAVSYERPMYIVSKNKQIKIWYCQRENIRNARVVKVSR